MRTEEGEAREGRGEEEYLEKCFERIFGGRERGDCCAREVEEIESTSDILKDSRGLKDFLTEEKKKKKDTFSPLATERSGRRISLEKLCLFRQAAMVLTKPSARQDALEFLLEFITEGIAEIEKTVGEEETHPSCQMPGLTKELWECAFLASTDSWSAIRRSVERGLETTLVSEKVLCVVGVQFFTHMEFLAETKPKPKWQTKEGILRCFATLANKCSELVSECGGKILAHVIRFLDEDQSSVRKAAIMVLEAYSMHESQETIVAACISLLNSLAETTNNVCFTDGLLGGIRSLLRYLDADSMQALWSKMLSPIIECLMHSASTIRISSSALLGEIIVHDLRRMPYRFREVFDAVLRPSPHSKDQSAEKWEWDEGRLLLLDCLYKKEWGEKNLIDNLHVQASDHDVGECVEVVPTEAILRRTLEFVSSLYLATSWEVYRMSDQLLPLVLGAIVHSRHKDMIYLPIWRMLLSKCSNADDADVSNCTLQLILLQMAIVLRELTGDHRKSVVGLYQEILTMPILSLTPVSRGRLVEVSIQIADTDENLKGCSEAMHLISRLLSASAQASAAAKGVLPALQCQHNKIEGLSSLFRYSWDLLPQFSRHLTPDTAVEFIHLVLPLLNDPTNEDKTLFAVVSSVSNALTHCTNISIDESGCLARLLQDAHLSIRVMRETLECVLKLVRISKSYAAVALPIILQSLQEKEEAAIDGTNDSSDSDWDEESTDGSDRSIDASTTKSSLLNSYARVLLELN